MSTPVGHMLAAGTVYQGTGPHSLNPVWMLAWIGVMANLPDGDLLFGFFSGNPNLYHHQWTHSLFFGLVMGVSAGLIFYLIRSDSSLRMGLLTGGAIISHIILDYFTCDSSPPYGLQIFWPFSKAYFISPVILFPDVHKASDSGRFLSSLFCLHNARTVAAEFLFLGPVFVAAWIIRRARQKRRPI
ncbi:MAG TPA: metal-dependent hydrolase [bacterium]|nr:metal-dependent hydrolase [bacterium]